MARTALAIATLMMFATAAAGAQPPRPEACIEAVWKKEFERAIKICTGVINAAQSNPRDMMLARQSRGTALARQGKLPEALADFDIALELSRTDPSLFNNRGGVYLRLGQPDKAIADFDAALEIDPKYLQAQLNRGIAHATVGAYESAIDDLGAVIETVPNFLPAYYNRGVAYQKSGDKDRAIADFRKILELSPENEVAKAKLKELSVSE